MSPGKVPNSGEAGGQGMLWAVLRAKGTGFPGQQRDTDGEGRGGAKEGFWLLESAQCQGAHHIGYVFSKWKYLQKAGAFSESEHVGQHEEQN